MAVFSIFATSASRNLCNKLLTSTIKPCLMQNRQMAAKRIMVIKPSRYSWNTMKDFLNLYLMLPLIPLVGIVAYCEIFIGEAELAEIPEGYTPDPWEYQKHPIKRWMAKHIYPSHQQEYEKYMHHLKEQYDRRNIRIIEERVKDLMKTNGDYQGWYYRPFTAKYIRQYRRMSDEVMEGSGFD